ncbi:MAG: hypothetical protein RPU61_14380 [Candidatus Sedimenticola sp. (ex Thyasira tokunagai)]
MMFSPEVAMSKTVIGKCWSCGRELESHDFGRETLCLGCGKPTRVCRNCRWYAPSYANECREPVAERVVDKERANFCAYFEATMDGVAGESAATNELLAAAEELFGKN